MDWPNTLMNHGRLGGLLLTGVGLCVLYSSRSPLVAVAGDFTGIGLFTAGFGVMLLVFGGGHQPRRTSKRAEAGVVSAIKARPLPFFVCAECSRLVEGPSCKAGHRVQLVATERHRARVLTTLSGALVLEF